MPIVERYGQPRVTPAALPDVRLTAAETAASEGAGVDEARAQRDATLAGVGESFARLGVQAYSQQQEEARQRADQTALINAKNQLDQWELSVINDPQTGVLTLKGKDAFDLAPKIDDAFNQTADNIEQGLGTDRQRQAFEAMRTDRHMSVMSLVERHVGQQIDAYHASELNATLDNSTNLAIANAQDPNRVAQELRDGELAIRQNAASNGQADDVTQQQIGAYRTGVHVGVIKQLVDNNLTQQAQDYFDAAKDQIDGSQLGAVQKTLEGASLLKQAQQQADSIIAAGGTLTEQREKARQIDDPKLRDEVTARLEHEAAVNEASQRQEEEATLTGAYNIVDKTHDVTAIPASTWSTLSGGARSALRGYAESLARGVPVQTDSPTYYALMLNASDNPEQFATTNLLSYRGKLDDADFHTFVNLQANIRAGKKGPTDASLDDFRTNEQIISDTLTSAGIDPKDKANEGAIATFRQQLGDAVGRAQRLANKKLGNRDVQALADDLVKTTAVQQDSWWNKLVRSAGVAAAVTNPSYASTILSQLRTPSTVQKPIIALTPADIAPDRPLLDPILRRSGLQVTDANALALAREAHTRLGDNLTPDAMTRLPKQDLAELAAALRDQGLTPTPDRLFTLYLQTLAHLTGGGR